MKRTKSRDPLVLYPHQEVGVSKIIETWTLRTYDAKSATQNIFSQKPCSGFLLFDEMGLGKTIQAWEALRRVPNREGPVLIISPSACSHVWTHGDYERYFSNDFEVRTFLDRQAVASTLENMTSETVVVTTFEMVRNAFKLYRAIRCQNSELSLDQMHRYCNVFRVPMHWHGVLDGEALRREMGQVITRHVEQHPSKIPNFAKNPENPRRIGYLSLLDTQWSVVILDEAHKIKNASSRITKAIGFLNSTYRLALTGTPLMNNVEDMISVLKYGLGYFDADWQHFLRFPNSEAFKQFLNLISLGRLKKDINQNLKNNAEPRIDERAILPWCADTFACDAYVRARISTLNAMTARESIQDGHSIFGVDSILAKIQRLRQICLHPELPHFYMDNTFVSSRSPICDLEFVRLVPALRTLFQCVLCCLRRNFPSLYNQTQMRRYLCTVILCAYQNGVVPSVKMWDLLNLYQQQSTPTIQNRIMVVSSYRGFLQNILMPWFNSINIRTLLFCGDGRSRQTATLNEFLGDPSVRMLLVVKTAGAHGLNVQSGASTCVLMDPHYNEALDEQAAHRIDRIGQTQRVTIHRQFMKGSIDEAMAIMQQKKRKQINAWLGRNNEKKTLEVVRLYLQQYDTVGKN